MTAHTAVELEIIRSQLATSTAAKDWWEGLHELHRYRVAEFHRFQRPLMHGEIVWAWKKQQLTHWENNTLCVKPAGSNT